jgi:pSer/pThr/pTyr-binding forkhead associated (FHA) protein
MLPERAMQAQLRVVQKQANIQQVRLLPETVIGRSTDCNLKIASTQVSRRHCRIVVNDIGVYIEDLCSANGTFLDGQRLLPNQPTLAPAGSQLVIGPATFVVEYRATTVPRPELGAASPRVAPVTITAAVEETAAIPLADVAAAIASDLDWQDAPAEAVFGDLSAGTEETPTATPPPETPKRMRSLFGLFNRGQKSETKTAAPVPFLPTEEPIGEPVVAESFEPESNALAEVAPAQEEAAVVGDEFSIGVTAEDEPVVEVDNPFRQFSQY